MISSRPLRVITALIVLFGLLFTQLSVASCLCPTAMAAAEDLAKSSDTSSLRMPGCADMDAMQPGLCQAHAQKDTLALDKPDLPQIPPFMAIGMVQLIQPVEGLLLRSTFIPNSVSLAFATAPPLAIQHCCFRI